MRPTDEVAGSFSLFDPALAEDPYPTYKHFRTKLPVAWSECHGGFWILSTYEYIDTAYHTPQIFSSFPNAIPENVGQPGRMIPTEIDPPEHTHYRRILDPYFGPKQIKEKVAEHAKKVANELIDGMVAKGECNFTADFATPFASTVFCEIAGWPLEKREWLVHTSRSLPGGGRIPTEEQIQELTMQLVPFFFELIETRREDPGDDVTSLMLSASFAGERPLSDGEILNQLFSLFLGGLETVNSALSNAFWFLGNHPAYRDQLTANAELIPDAVDELLRYESPVAPGRTLTQDTEILGVPMFEGERVLLLTGSAGRDETVFDTPEEVDFSRESKRHLAFAAGNHRCLGSHMARLEMRIAYEEIHRRMPGYFVPPGAPIEKHLGFSRGIEHLPFNVGQETFV